MLKIKRHINYRGGQILLITIMLLATTLAIVLSASFTSRTETQVTKLEESSQKALAAAEAGIEAALKQGNLINFDSLGLSNDIKGSAVIDTISNSEFTSPILRSNEQYTFYLSEPAGPQDNPFSFLKPAYANHGLTVCFDSKAALEITLVKNNALTPMKKYAVNPSDASIIDGDEVQQASGTTIFCPSDKTYSGSFSIPSTDIGDDSVLLIVRAISSPTNVGFKGDVDLPIQGKIITSTASTTQSTKTVQLFQSYPQIPTDFFVSGF